VRVKLEPAIGAYGRLAKGSLLLTDRLGIRSPLSAWPAGGDPGTQELLAGGTVDGGTIELADPITPYGMPTDPNTPALAFTPGPLLTVSGPWRSMPVGQGSGFWLIRLRYAFGICRRLAAMPGPAVVLEHRVEFSRTDGASGTAFIGLGSQQNSAGSNGLVAGVTGIAARSGGGWGPVGGDQTPNYGPAGCAHECADLSGGACERVWSEYNHSVAGGGLAGHVLSWRHVLEVSEAAAIQLVSADPA
jgi:hypothetical protein